MTTVIKALNLLEFFTYDEPELSLSRIQLLSGYDKGTVHRHLKSLKACGYLEQNQATRAYHIGPTVLRLARVRENTRTIDKIVANHVDSLANQLQELVHASVLQKDCMKSLCFKDGGKGGTRVGFDETELLPLHATSSGIAMLAFGPENLMHTLPKPLHRFTPHTLSNMEALKKAVIKTKHCGYAHANQSFESDVCSVAVPFYENDAVAIGCLAIATPASRMKDAQKKSLAKLALATAEKLSRDLGSSVYSNKSQVGKQPCSA